mmetsp:Transcript_45699/g.55467  ORF Transcript_45699/g.55467 Transcript_45699/m.55467 type:complete len:514 (-) Transcript_45699:442-1983(-)
MSGKTRKLSTRRRHDKNTVAVYHDQDQVSKPCSSTAPSSTQMKPSLNPLTLDLKNATISATPSRSHLVGVRVVQRRAILISGLSSNVAKEKVLKRHDYFGKYGRICKCVVDPERTATALTTENLKNLHCSSTAYIAFMNERNALHAVRASNGTMVGKGIITTSLATLRYCDHFLKGNHCDDIDCLLLHELVDDRTAAATLATAASTQGNENVSSAARLLTAATSAVEKGRRRCRQVTPKGKESPSGVVSFSESSFFSHDFGVDRDAVDLPAARELFKDDDCGPRKNEDVWTAGRQSRDLVRRRSDGPWAIKSPIMIASENNKNKKAQFLTPPRISTNLLKKSHEDNAISYSPPPIGGTILANASTDWTRHSTSRSTHASNTCSYFSDLCTRHTVLPTPPLSNQALSLHHLIQQPPWAASCQDFSHVPHNQHHELHGGYHYLTSRGCNSVPMMISSYLQQQQQQHKLQSQYSIPLAPPPPMTRVAGSPNPLLFQGYHPCHVNATTTNGDYGGGW